MPYASVGGIDTYYESAGAGEPVLLLHGGFCSLEMMRPHGDALAAHFTVHAPERPGHGRTADAEGPMSYAQGVRDTLGFLDAIGVDSAHVVGFSDGAIIGLLLALQHPDRIRSLVAISGNLSPAGLVGSGEDADAAVEADAEPDAEPDADAAAEQDGDTEVDEDWERIRAEYRALTPDGPDHEKVVLDKLFRMWTSEPDIDAAELATITVPTLIMAADRDAIRPEHTRLMADSIPGAQLCIVPGATHMLLTQRPALIDLVLVEFLDEAAGGESGPGFVDDVGGPV